MEDVWFMRRDSQKGFTILELIAVLGVVMLMAVAALATLSGVRRADVSTASVKLATTIRYIYDTAVLNNGTYRLVIDFESGAWWAERVDTSQVCGGTAVLPSEDELDDSEPSDGNIAAKDDGSGTGGLAEMARSSNPFEGGAMANQMWAVAGGSGGETGAGQEAPNLATIAAAAVSGGGDTGAVSTDPVDVARAQKAKLRKSRARLRDSLLQKNVLPKGITFKRVMTTHQDEPTEEGMAEIFFFPSGYVERSYIFLARDDEIYTVETIPMRGIGLVHKKELDSRDLLAFQ